MDQNLYKLCFCKKEMTKYKSKFGICKCCYKEYNPNKMEFYWCGRGRECEYNKISTDIFQACSKCFNKIYDETDDNKNDFISIKTKTNIKIISEEIKKLNDIQKRKKYMFRIYTFLYTAWISKLNDDELTQYFNDFYNKALEKIRN
eukprot:353083_1